jgi:hypothetical protein
MTKFVFRISWNDQQKLEKIAGTFETRKFTRALARTCCPELTTGDIQRWYHNLYIQSVGKTYCGKYANKAVIWKITDRVIERLAQPKRGAISCR